MYAEMLDNYYQKKNRGDNLAHKLDKKKLIIGSHNFVRGKEGTY